MPYTAFLGAVLATAGAVVLTSPTDIAAQVSNDRQQRNTPPRPSERQAAEPGEQMIGLGQGALAEWLVAQLSQAQSVSQFAMGRTEDEQVQSLARNAARAYAALAQELENVAPPVASAGNGRSDLGEELEEVAETIQEEAQTRQETGNQEPGDTEVARREARRPVQEPARQRADAEAADGDDDSAGLLRRENGILARLRAAAADRNANRGTARERLERVLPALRASLPELVDLMTEAIEEGTQPATLAWLELQRDHSERYAQSVQEELSQYSGEEFDKAYLGYELLTSLRLADALQSVQQRTESDLRPIRQENLQTLRSLSHQARQLMGAGRSDGGNQP